MPAWTGPTFQIPFRARLSILMVLLVGASFTLVGFFLTRDSHRREVAAQFNAVGRERAESVIHGFETGFEDVALLRNFFEASEDVSRKDFDAFVVPILARHPYIQAFQWLPEVTPRNRAALEAEARRAYPGFQFFRRNGLGQDVALAPDAVFHAVLFVAPFHGNEVTLGYSAEGLPTRQEALARALRTGSLAASGRIKLIQEPGQQAGLLVMCPVRGKDGRTAGVVQGVFRMGDLVRKSLALLEPEGVLLQLLDAGAPDSEALLHQEPSPLPDLGPSKEDGLHLVRTFDLAGRTWTLVVTPAGGRFSLGTPAWSWAVLLAGLAFSALLAGYLKALLTGQAQVHSQVEARTRELAQETASHRRDAQALRESEARFRHLVEVMGEGLWVLDAEGVTTFVNHRMAEMLGYGPAEMVGQSMFAFMVEGDLAQAKALLAERQAGHGSQHDFRFLRSDGTERWTIVTATPLMDDEGKVVSILGVVTDITERRRQEQSMLQSQKLESLGVLAGGIAHDFNNLLTTLLGNISLAQLCLPEVSPAWPYLTTMERTVQRATDLTRQMLAYSGKGRFVVAPVDLNQVVEEMSHLLGVSISKKVALRYHLQEKLPVLMAEASQIQQVVMNLVTNASEAIGDGEGIVSIRTGLKAYGRRELARDYPGQAIEPGTFLTLEVSDTGKGMAPEVQARIFEPFFTTKFTGRGLGLAAMQGILRGHRGGIRVYSEVGKGTTFKLIFPAGSGEAMAAVSPDGVTDWMGTGTILVVDDEEGVRQVAADLLKSMGFEVILAEDGLQALERFRENAVRIKAVLMDLTMPHLDGVETFRALRHLDPACRVVLTSGYNEQEAIQDFLGKGLVAFVQKPFLRADLMKAMQKALEG
jgi:PAS domain S-box-containing protein